MEGIGYVLCPHCQHQMIRGTIVINNNSREAYQDLHCTNPACPAFGAFKVPEEIKDDTRNTPGNNGQYTGKVQPIDLIIAQGLDFLEGNVVKYVTRWRKKGGLEDLKKAKQYLDWLIERETNKDSR